MKNLIIVLIAGLIGSIPLQAQTNRNAVVSEMLVEFVKKNDSKAVSRALLKGGTNLPDSLINNSSFKSSSYAKTNNGHHLIFVKRERGNYSYYHAIVYDNNYNPIDEKEFPYKCKECISTDVKTTLWMPKDKQEKDFFIEYYQKDASSHVPMYPIHGIKKEYYKVNGSGKIILTHTSKK